MKMLLTLLLAVSSVCVYAQRSEQWLQQHDAGNFHEGTYTREVSAAPMELISLTAYWEPYEFGQRQNLKVRFYSPEASDFFLKVEELAVKKYYWLQNKPQHIPGDWYEFSGWQVDRWLRRLQLPASSLGLAVQLGPKEMRQFLPAWVYHQDNQPATARYIAQVRLGINTDGGAYQVYQGKKRDAASLVKEGQLLGQYGGSCFPIVIQAHELPASGWYSVAVSVTEKGSGDPHSYSFLFYHAPQPNSSK